MDRGRSVSATTRRIAAAVVVIVLVAVGAFAVGRLTAPVVTTPSSTSAEAGFARDMQVHHAQAVDMSLTVRDLTDDEAVRLLAYDIATTQLQQSGQMYGWLAEWNLPQASDEPAMTWMTRPALSGEAEHGHETEMHSPGDPMPGYATPDQLNRLASLEGVEAERYFLELMIEHHKGGVEMAEAILARSTDDVVVDFAESVVTGQTAEITAMEDMLAERS
jgi:uncharacterized protein (DUF305 family)